MGFAEGEGKSEEGVLEACHIFRRNPEFGARFRKEVWVLNPKP